MVKLKRILLTILTLGIYPLISTNRKIKSQLSIAKKIPFKIDFFVSMIGGYKNIKKIDSTHTRIKIVLIDKKIINIEAIKKINHISGVMISGNTISCIVGNSAKIVEEFLVARL